MTEQERTVDGEISVIYINTGHAMTEDEAAILHKMLCGDKEDDTGRAKNKARRVQQKTQ